MKKALKWLGVLFFFGIICAGCGNDMNLHNPLKNAKVTQSEPQNEQAMEPPSLIHTSDESLSQIESIIKNQELESVDAMEVSEDSEYSDSKTRESLRMQLGLDEAGVLQLKKEQAGNYYFELLNTPGQTMYVEIYRILETLAQDVELSGTDIDNLGMVYQAVINDHPELFYLKGYKYVSHKEGDELKFITFSGDYIYDKETVRQRQLAIEKKAQEILNQIPKGQGEYDIVKEVYEYIIMHTEYSFDAADNQNICSVFLGNESVCNGYAKAAQYLLQKRGVKTILVNGNAGGGLHAWNIVQIDGAFYHMDVTWGDPSYYDESQSDARTPEIDYSYLCVTTQEIQKTHTFAQTFPLPECNSQSANYFVQEGLYFESVNSSQLESIFTQAKNNGEKCVMIKASNPTVYQELCQFLLTEEHIFDYFQMYDSEGNMSVAYAGNEQTGTLSFWQ